MNSLARSVSMGLLVYALISAGAPPPSHAGQPVFATIHPVTALGTISEQRAVLRSAYYLSLQEISDAQAAGRTLPRGQANAFASAISGTAVTMRAAAAAISAATTQTQVDAAA
ncbi:hypothetical protein NG702_21160, partial [Pseudarthrobacter sp. MDT3-28]|uniref:hypothetical protein n=1 Tax=Pseudarthrobacter raffinosi TaxID=2953651 RepID=UPI00208E9944